MSRIRLRYVQAWVDQDGRVHHYFRRAGFPRIRLPGLPGSEQFMNAYQQALTSAPEPVGASRSKAGSVAAAIASYLGGPSFRDLAADTQYVRRSVLEHFRRPHGDKMLAAMPRKFLQALFDSMTPSAARNTRNALRAVFEHCIQLEMLEEDPTRNIKLQPIKSDGYHTWSEEEIAQFETHHPIGSNARLALALGLYSGQRRGDAIRMGRQHLRECLDEQLRQLGVRSILAVRQQKTGTPLKVPVHPRLQAALDLVPADQLTFLTNGQGKPFAGKDFTQWFARQCAAAGLPSECTFHGLRKAFCVRRANAGLSVNQIAAGSGHKSLREVERYTRGADQERLARDAMAREMAADNVTGAVTKSWAR